MDKTGIKISVWDATGGAEHKWCEGSMYNVRDSLFIGPLLPLTFITGFKEQMSV